MRQTIGQSDNGPATRALSTILAILAILSLPSLPSVAQSIPETAGQAAGKAIKDTLTLVPDGVGASHSKDSLSLVTSGTGKAQRRRKGTDRVLESRYEGFAPEFLDTVEISKSFEINDYTLIGVEYGASLSRMSFNPVKLQTNLFAPNTFGIFLTRYGKLFNYIPNFGFKVGARYSHEGYKFKENKETKVTADIEGATEALMEVVEVPLMAHFHFDILHFKVMADAGIYGGYRLSIERSGGAVADEIRHRFLDTDRRLDYGWCGGLGFGLVFDPVEFHVNANLRYSLGTIYDPDYYHKDYYRFAYPLDIMLTAGFYFQLTKRTGKSKPQLRREAYDKVFNSEVGRNLVNTTSYAVPDGKSR